MIAYITSLYSVRDGYLDQLYDEFKKLLPLLEGHRLFVWTDRTIPFPLPANVECIEAPLASLTSYITCVRAKPALELPRNRNHAKDTMEFMALMNSKVEMVWRTLPLLSEGVDGVAWIDAGICKIFGGGDATNQSRVRVAFKRLSRWTPRMLTMPGCWNPGRPSEDAVCWRFCGGFFGLPVAAVDDFHRATQTILEKWISRGRLAWEVNLWADMEMVGIGPKIRWFAADHNITMMEVPEDA
jgi:hypothetical protein